MSLLVFNGSPRGERSNSAEIINWFTRYIPDSETIYLKKVTQHEVFIEESRSHDRFLFVFPLYVDGMPAQVKVFFELMYSQKDIFKDKEVTYIIHSGFSEAIHNKNLQKYLRRFSQLMGLKNYGAFILPGSEGFRLMPARMTAKKAKMVAQIGQSYIQEQVPQQGIIKALEGPLVQSPSRARRFRFLSKLGVTNLYWDRQLKKNGVFTQRFSTPYKL